MTGPGARPGLRERKKLKTRIAIRNATYRLISEQGYGATTIEQIAEAAEVSPSTVVRYFPSKEDIVLTDEYDPQVEAALRSRPADEPLIESLRTVIKQALRHALDAEPDEMLLRTKLMVEVPAVRARMMQSMSVTGRMLCGVVAERTGRQADDLEVRVLSMSVVAAVMETGVYWAEGGRQDDLIALVDRALDTLKGDFTL
ncbi:TetR family transcriptional regulator [Streptomyces sp. ISL-98]|uniref:TetR/AcrR family transcriptional regulator n=1 Tax=Streptomyces sp. ISL-98 TaxID=2819192 RepID=UPI001BE9099E|nr:TetR family transcriptional regulator [Streptomyces sp. ISL-98]MBT2510302.1 TetR family transcriptional regulator [Streptomyces sp. ISL-98]